MDEILDARTQLLVALGAATAAKCQGCFAKLHGVAIETGISDRELRAVVAIAAKVTAKSHAFMAAFIEETTKGAVPARADGTGPTLCGC